MDNKELETFFNKINIADIIYTRKDEEYIEFRLKLESRSRENTDIFLTNLDPFFVSKKIKFNNDFYVFGIIFGVGGTQRSGWVDLYEFEPNKIMEAIYGTQDP